MSGQTPRRPRDSNHLTKLMLDLATGVIEEAPPCTRVDVGRENFAAVSLGRLGGLKGGAARALKLSPEKRREIAQVAARVRWKK